MADLTANAYIRIWGEATTDEWLADTLTANHFYKGQPVILDISEDTVKARAYVDGITVAADDIFLGIAAEEVNLAAGAAETTYVTVYMEPTVVGFKSAVFTDADVGDPVYMSDSATLSATVGDNPVLGKLVRVKDGFAYVRLSSPTICSGA